MKLTAKKLLVPPDLEEKGSFVGRWMDILKPRFTHVAEITVAGQGTEDEREDTLEYLEDFWETLESERNARRRIEEGCRRL